MDMKDWFSPQIWAAIELAVLCIGPVAAVVGIAGYLIVRSSRHV